MTPAFLKAIELWAGNPFLMTDPGTRESVRREVLAGPITAELSRRVRRGELTSAKRLILAVGHAQACAPEVVPKAVLTTAELPASILKDLSRPRADYLRIAMAAGRAHFALGKLLGGSSAMVTLRQDIWAACFGESLLHCLELERVIRDHDVLILGETGTGKEVVAQVFLEATPGPASGNAAPQAALNAAAIPDTLVESELFGHERGAFTGATEARLGRLRVAAGGAFFLDEIGDLPKTTQVKLLRVMETNEIHPLGSDVGQKADVRYIAATHKDLEAMVVEGEFRRDLFGRLAGITLRIPPLRERPEDIEAIGLSFIDQYLRGSKNGQASQAIARWLRSSEARSYSWPGNVRELQNVLRNLLLGLPPGLKSDARPTERPDELPAAIRDGHAPLQVVSDWYIDKVITRTDRNLTAASQILGVDRSTLRRRLKRQVQG